MELKEDDNSTAAEQLYNHLMGSDAVLNYVDENEYAKALLARSPYQTNTKPPVEAEDAYWTEYYQLADRILADLLCDVIKVCLRPGQAAVGIS